MPITKSAKKALRQSKKRHLENLTFKKAFRAAIKDFRKEVSAGNLEKAKTLMPTVYQTVDKASRYKSRLAQSLNKKQNKA